MAEEIGIHINVVGFHGRKGVKEDPTVMGTAVQFLAIESAAPTLIIKDPKTRDDRPDGYRFGACIDGSDQSKESLEFIKRVRGPGDKITVIICEQENIDAN